MPPATQTTLSDPPPPGWLAYLHRTDQRRRSQTRKRDLANLRKPSVDFSLTGLIYCGMMMFLGLAAVNTQANLLFAVFGLMVGVLFISVGACRLVLMKVRVQRVIPENAAVGETATVQYRFHNAKLFWPTLSITLAELESAQAFVRQPHAYALHVAPGTTAVINVELAPSRRGIYRLGSYQLSTSFPFGFIKRAVLRRKEDTILIYPPVGEVSPRLLQLCRSAERTGANRKPRRGGSDEFYGVKEFRPGENPRWIHWRRSARTGQLVVRDMAQISPPRLLILLDTYLPHRNPDGIAAVEKSVAQAASLAGRALEGGMAVGLCAWSDGWKTIAPQRGKQHAREILAALASVPDNQSATPQQLSDQSLGLTQNEVTIILFTPQSVEIGLSLRARGTVFVVTANS
ncbi:MAG: DUF58 domain-containing protein, partial [Tepidisphaeraceae bacterium]